MTIEQLRQTVPPPPTPFEVGTADGWSRVESQLGTALPRDYKDLVDTYGTGGFNDFLYVFNPFANNKYRNLLNLKQEMLEAYATSQGNFPDEYPDPIYPEPAGLLPWARTDNGDEFYWKTEGAPENWSIVVIKARNVDQLRYQLTTTDFLVRLLTRQLDPPVFPDDFFEDDAPYFIART